MLACMMTPCVAALRAVGCAPASAADPSKEPAAQSAEALLADGMRGRLGDEVDVYRAREDAKERELHAVESPADRGQLTGEEELSTESDAAKSQLHELEGQLWEETERRLTSDAAKSQLQAALADAGERADATAQDVVRMEAQLEGVGRVHTAMALLATAAPLSTLRLRLREMEGQLCDVVSADLAQRLFEPVWAHLPASEAEAQAMWANRPTSEAGPLAMSASLPATDAAPPETEEQPTAKDVAPREEVAELQKERDLLLAEVVRLQEELMEKEEVHSAHRQQLSVLHTDIERCLAIEQQEHEQERARWVNHIYRLASERRTLRLKVKELQEQPAAELFKESSADVPAPALPGTPLRTRARQSPLKDVDPSRRAWRTKEVPLASLRSSAPQSR